MAQVFPSQACDETDVLVLSAEVSTSSSVAKRAGLAVGVLGMTAAVAAALLPSVRPTMALGVKRIGQKEQRVVITPSFPACSKAKENCLPTGCCQVSGHTCFMKNDHEAYCNETCSSQSGSVWSCSVPANSAASVPVQNTLDKSLYCFSVYTHNTGSSKHNYELDLLRQQHRQHVSIYTCDGWDVFSDVEVEISDHYLTHKVEDKLQEFHVVKREETGAYVNWGFFYQIWLQVRQLGRWEEKSWTVKVDPDAVFVPERLQGWLESRSGEPPHGMYFENCKDVQYGFFGNLEVLSHEATRVLTTYLEECHSVFAPCAFEGCDWKFGPWGEDVFVQRCLDRHYVDKVAAFDMTLDGACPADRPQDQKKNKKWHVEDCSQVKTAAVHPFKTPKEYFTCLSQITHVTHDQSEGLGMSIFNAVGVQGGGLYE